MAFELDLKAPAGWAVDRGLVPAGTPIEVEELTGGDSASDRPARAVVDATSCSTPPAASGPDPENREVGLPPRTDAYCLLTTSPTRMTPGVITFALTPRRRSARPGG